ncbi:type II toxin-antitoxin system RatA family toxin [Streptomyces sp. JJ36]|uniref:type II toxin-antitoxin system RatA family toxin n=1 Tax=Streptomyces sp. JJ36 TaxID=2736645 RepID=UPI001F23D558|nr:SRPBCC family protein [Streptomyces sp. JJ36]MCF6521801.1 SRPBCC family protein [Streptomyces sp. JJ36]
MRSVHVALDLPGTDPETAFDGIREFERYPDLAPDVRSVVAHDDSSDWEVYFRNGILRWTEKDTEDREQRVITFAQDDGDFEDFGGEWRVLPQDDGCRIAFRADFDFGIPSLVGILDPVAERVIKETIARVVKGMFDGARVVDDEQLTRALAAAGV